jgi:thioredoxin-like negative regulator of GroEL
MSAQIGAASDGNFEVAVSESKQPVLMVFGPQWYGPRRALGPIVESACEVNVT